MTPDDSNKKRTWNAFFQIQIGNVFLIFAFMGILGLLKQTRVPTFVSFLIAVVAALAYFRMWQMGRTRPRSEFRVGMLIVVSIIIVTSAAHLLGGIRGPALFLYVIPILSAAQFLPRRWFLDIAFTSFVAFNFLALAELQNWLPPSSQLIYITTTPLSLQEYGQSLLLMLLLCIATVWNYWRANATMQATLGAVRENEERFRDLFENASDLIQIVDVNQRYQFVNQAWLKTLGYSAEEIANLTLSDTIAPESREHCERAFQKVLHGESIDNIEAVFLTKTGTRVIVQGSVTANRKDNHFIATRGIFRDVTRIKEDEVRQKRLLKLTALHSEISELFLSQGVQAIEQVLQQLGTTLDVSRAYIFQARNSDWVIDNTHEWCAPGITSKREESQGVQLENLIPSWQRILHDHGTVFAADVANLPDELRAVLHPEGVLSVLLVVFSINGQPVGVIGVDETRHTRTWLPEETTIIRTVGENYAHLLERSMAEVQLVAARDAALESARLKSQFVANMSHEIRTPMNGVLGMLDLLQASELTDLQSDYVSTARSSAESLLTIINDILDFSKIEAGKMDLSNIEFDLEQVVDDVCELMAGPAHAKGLELVAFVHKNTPKRVIGDPIRVRQVLLNLVSNAVKFTDRGEVVVRAQLENIKDEQLLVRFVVSDTGIGISEEQQRTIFDSCVQADGSNTRRYGGTGLGLTISRQLVELMGGHIGLQSTRGTGSSFWFTITFASAKNATTEIDATNLQGVRILVVDDNATNRKILHQQLFNWKCNSEEVTSGTEAIEQLHKAQENQQPFQIVLCDWQMPVMDGKTLCEKIKADPELASTSIILLTSVGMTNKAEELEQIGFDAQLIKPVRQRDLYATINSVLNKEVTPQKHVPVSLIVINTTAEKPKVGGYILLAEDNVINQKLASHILERIGYRAEIVNNGREAVQAYIEKPYDLILMDVQMPELDGFGATEEIRDYEQKHGGHLPIIALTAGALVGDRERCLASGMDGYVSKPFKPDELQAEVVRWATLPAINPAPLSDLRALSSTQSKDSNIINDILNQFMNELPSYLKKMQLAIENDNAEMLRRAAHGLKGSGGSFGADRLTYFCAHIEDLAYKKQLDKAQLWVKKLPQEIERLQQENNRATK